MTRPTKRRWCRCATPVDNEPEQPDGPVRLLDVEGLEAGQSFDVVYVTGEGDEVAAGSLLAVDGVLMRCRFNAATLRRDVRQIVVRRAGEALLSAELPTVEVVTSAAPAPRPRRGSSSSERKGPVTVR